MDITTIWQFDLRKGNSPDPREGACALDAVSWLEYGTLGDHPPCVCPVIAAFVRGINDAMTDTGRQRLKPFLPRLVGTVDQSAEQQRAEYLAWQAINVFAPLALDVAGFYNRAAKLRAMRGDLKHAADAARAAARATAIAADAAHTAAHAAADAVAAASYAAASYAAAAANAAAAASYAAGHAAADAVAAASYAAALASAAADASVYEDAMIAALDGVLKIGRQAESILPARLIEANERFALART